MNKKKYIIPVSDMMQLHMEGVIAASGHKMNLNEDHLKEEFASKKNPIWE